MSLDVISAAMPSLAKYFRMSVDSPRLLIQSSSSSQYGLGCVLAGAARRRIDLASLLLQLLIGKARRLRLKSEVGRHRRPPVHHDRAAQLATVLVEILFGFHVDNNRRADEGRRERRRPRPGISDDAQVPAARSSRSHSAEDPIRGPCGRTGSSATCSSPHFDN